MLAWRNPPSLSEMGPWGGEGDAVGSRPGEAAIGGSEHPGAEERLPLGGGGALGGLRAGKEDRIPLFWGCGFGHELLIGE